MNNSLLVAAALLAGTSSLTATLHAGNVSWGVSIGSWGGGIGVGVSAGSWGAPPHPVGVVSVAAPVVVHPAPLPPPPPPVVYAPAPVVYASAPVVHVPVPVVHAPGQVMTYAAPPVVYVPAPVAVGSPIFVAPVPVPCAPRVAFRAHW